MSTFDTTNPHVSQDSRPLIVNINPPKQNRLKNYILIFAIFTMIFLIILLISNILIIVFKQKVLTSPITTTSTTPISTATIGKEI